MVCVSQKKIPPSGWKLAVYVSASLLDSGLPNELFAGGDLVLSSLFSGLGYKPWHKDYTHSMFVE